MIFGGRTKKEIFSTNGPACRRLGVSVPLHLRLKWTREILEETNHTIGRLSGPCEISTEKRSV
uniref:Uncharacterized protein n=1 Tax=Arundo donax TaxID=35708 RepID=A0A0A9G292_ARUDO